MIVPTRRQVTTAGFTLILLFVGLGVGFLAGNDFNFDRHSYMGGVSYITAREDAGSYTDINSLNACALYVKEGRHTLDGYLSGSDFLAGCQDAYNQQSPSAGRETLKVTGEVRVPTDSEIRGMLETFCRSSGGKC